MTAIPRITCLMTALALVATACGPGEDRIDQFDQDPVTIDGTQATLVDLQQVRSDVDSIMSSLRTEVEALRGEVREDRIDRWTQLTSDVEETRGEVMESLRQVEAADRDEAHRIRERTSERLAEIEADVARNEIELTADAPTLERRVDEHVQRLQSDIGYLQDQLRDYQTRDRGDDGWLNLSRGLDADHFADWQDELAEIRSDLRERTADGDAVEDIASDLSDRVADLTRDVREHKHAIRWGTLDQVR